MQVKASLTYHVPSLDMAGTGEVVGADVAWNTWAWVPLVAVPLVALLVAWSTGSTSMWRTRKLPKTVPHKSVFGPVWFVLYVLMGYSLTRVLQEGDVDGYDWRHWLYIGLFSASFLMNLAWSPLFGKNTRHALFLVLTLAMVLALQLFLALDIDFVAGFVLIPYLVWVSYATLMNHDVVLGH